MAWVGAAAAFVVVAGLMILWAGAATTAVVGFVGAEVVGIGDDGDDAGATTAGVDAGAGGGMVTVLGVGAGVSSASRLEAAPRTTVA